MGCTASIPAQAVAAPDTKADALDIDDDSDPEPLPPPPDRPQRTLVPAVARQSMANGLCLCPPGGAVDGGEDSPDGPLPFLNLTRCSIAQPTAADGAVGGRRLPPRCAPALPAEPLPTDPDYEHSRSIVSPGEQRALSSGDSPLGASSPSPQQRVLSVPNSPGQNPPLRGASVSSSAAASPPLARPLSFLTASEAFGGSRTGSRSPSLEPRLSTGRASFGSLPPSMLHEPGQEAPRPVAVVAIPGANLSGSRPPSDSTGRRPSPNPSLSQGSSFSASLHLLGSMQSSSSFSRGVIPAPPIGHALSFGTSFEGRLSNDSPKSHPRANSAAAGVDVSEKLVRLPSQDDLDSENGHHGGSSEGRSGRQAVNAHAAVGPSRLAAPVSPTQSTPTHSQSLPSVGSRYSIAEDPDIAATFSEGDSSDDEEDTAEARRKSAQVSAEVATALAQRRSMKAGGRMSPKTTTASKQAKATSTPHKARPPKPPAEGSVSPSPPLHRPRPAQSRAEAPSEQAIVEPVKVSETAKEEDSVEIPNSSSTGCFSPASPAPAMPVEDQPTPAFTAAPCDDDEFNRSAPLCVSPPSKPRDAFSRSAGHYGGLGGPLRAGGDGPAVASPALDEWKPIRLAPECQVRTFRVEDGVVAGQPRVEGPCVAATANSGGFLVFCPRPPSTPSPRATSPQHTAQQPSPPAQPAPPEVASDVTKATAPPTGGAQNAGDVMPLSPLRYERAQGTQGSHPSQGTGTFTAIPDPTTTTTDVAGLTLKETEKPATGSASRSGPFADGSTRSQSAQRTSMNASRTLHHDDGCLDPVSLFLVENVDLKDSDDEHLLTLRSSIAGASHHSASVSRRPARGHGVHDSDSSATSRSGSCYQAVPEQLPNSSASPVPTSPMEEAKRSQRPRRTGNNGRRAEGARRGRKATASTFTESDTITLMTATDSIQSPDRPRLDSCLSLGGDVVASPVTKARPFSPTGYRQPMPRPNAPSANDRQGALTPQRPLRWSPPTQRGRGHPGDVSCADLHPRASTPRVALRPSPPVPAESPRSPRGAAVRRLDAGEGGGRGGGVGAFARHPSQAPEHLMSSSSEHSSGSGWGLKF